MTVDAVGVMLCDDLIFTSKVTATANAHNLGVIAARSADQAVKFAALYHVRCVIVDLHNPGLDLPALLAELRAACPAVPRVVGYGSHVDAERLKAARQAGCDVVLPRSKFVADLEAKLPGWLGSGEPAA